MSDFLNVNLNFGLTGTSLVVGAVLAVALIFQFRAPRYVPFLYWLNVFLISIFGTLVTDNLTDAMGFPLEYSTIIFSGLLLGTFALWYTAEKTLSIHSIYTMQREAFYWLAVFFTFALGTASGDLMAQALGLGFLTTGLIIVGVVVLMALAWRFGLNSILSFWVIYIMTRPLGASLGDLLAQSPQDGGLGFGAMGTSAIFVVGIIVTVAYLILTKADVTDESTSRAEEAKEEHEPHALLQVVVVALLFAIASFGGYAYRHAQIQAQIQAAETAARASGSPPAPLGDLSAFDTLAQQILDAVRAGDWTTANAHVDELEHAWDVAVPLLKPRDGAAWTRVDGALDTVFRAVRAVRPDQQAAVQALTELQTVLSRP